MHRTRSVFPRRAPRPTKQPAAPTIDATALREFIAGALRTASIQRDQNRGAADELLYLRRAFPQWPKGVRRALAQRRRQCMLLVESHWGRTLAGLDILSRFFPTK
jgi:hypothetical protein